MTSESRVLLFAADAYLYQGQASGADLQCGPPPGGSVADHGHVSYVNRYLELSLLRSHGQLDTVSIASQIMGLPCNGN